MSAQLDKSARDSAGDLRHWLREGARAYRDRLLHPEGEELADRNLMMYGNREGVVTQDEVDACNAALERHFRMKPTHRSNIKNSQMSCDYYKIWAKSRRMQGIRDLLGSIELVICQKTK